VTVDGMTFAQTWSRELFDARYGKAWQVDLDRLCAFVGGAYGDRGVHELRAHAARYRRTAGRVDRGSFYEDKLREASNYREYRDCDVRRLNQLVGNLAQENFRLNGMVDQIAGRLRGLLERRRPFFRWRRMLGYTVRDIEFLQQKK